MLSSDSKSGPQTRDIEYVSTGKSGYFKVICGDGSELGIIELQPPGKKPMDAKAYQNGIRGLQSKLRWDSPTDEESTSTLSEVTTQPPQ